jgi:hypothetical protein
MLIGNLCSKFGYSLKYGRNYSFAQGILKKRHPLFSDLGGDSSELPGISAAKARLKKTELQTIFQHGA